MFQFTEKNFVKLIEIFGDVANQAGCVVSKRMAYDANHKPLFGKETLGTDYVRWRTLQLVAEQIERRQLQGAIAEAGVWKGAFSYVLSHVFPDRKFYLFDTFSGFDNTEIKDEVASGKIDSYFLDKMTFADTSVENVRKILPHAENCVFCKGLFEKTSAQVEDNFIFASLDMDLYKPMYQALEYFYPRLVPGGYLFLHDYNHAMIRGVHDVINDYENKAQCRLTLVPLPDEGGTLVITK